MNEKTTLYLTVSRNEIVAELTENIGIAGVLHDLLCIVENDHENAEIAKDRDRVAICWKLRMLIDGAHEVAEELASL